MSRAFEIQKGIIQNPLSHKALDADENYRLESGASERTIQLNKMNADENCKYRFNVVGEDAAVLAEVVA
jgi:hypothetical protein